MADTKVNYLVKPNARNRNGYSAAFEVFTGYADDGSMLFEQSRTIAPGRQVLAVDDNVVYRVSVGNPMTAAELQPRAGDLVRVSCSDVPAQAATLWMVLDDDTVVETTRASRQVTDEQFAELLLRVPLPPAVPEPLPAEGG